MDSGTGVEGADSVIERRENMLQKEFENSNAQDNDEDEVKVLSPSSSNQASKVGEEIKMPKKRGRKPKSQILDKSASAASASAPEACPKDEEDVCFLCYDGGDLVMCDERSCPKAYHASCVGQDEDFFQSGPWTCGWHKCTSCEKPAKYFCYTCTFSVCKVCFSDEEFLCVRKNKGFCENCLQLVLMIEENKEESDGVHVDFSDTETWEFLFKDYWREVKEKLSMTLDEIQKANDPSKNADDLVEVSESDETFDEHNESDSTSGSESTHIDDLDSYGGSKRKKRRKKFKSGRNNPSCSVSEKRKERFLSRDFTGWASDELLEIIGHLKQDIEKPLSLFEVQRLLLTYVRENKLQDYRKRSMINCDERLQKLFGRPSVGQFQMLKLLESHVSSKQPAFTEGSLSHENPNESLSEQTPEEHDDSIGRGGRVAFDKRRRSRKKIDGDSPQENPLDYAAINSHNIGLVFLRRSLIEDLLEDLSTFNDKVVGSFIRIRVHAGNRQDACYRIVPIVGTRKVSTVYNTGRRTTDLILEVLNLDKKEDVAIDTVSNQDFTEEECKRLRQSVRCGLISRPTVSELEEKAKALHEVKVNDWFETEILRMSHLRDRASEKGLRKELRECVEKLQLLSNPEERRRKLEDTPDVLADTNDSLDQDSEEDKPKERDQDTQTARLERGYTKRAWDGYLQSSGKFTENSRRSQSSWGSSNNTSSHGWSYNGTDINDYNKKSTMWNHKYENKVAETGYSEVSKPRDVGGSHDWSHSQAATAASDLMHRYKSRTEVPRLSASKAGSSGKSNSTDESSESDKIWHYRDPKSIVQGPFTMMQLRKWSTAGFFPLDLRIWKTHETEEKSILLTDALAGKFYGDSDTSDGKSCSNLTFNGSKIVEGNNLSESIWRRNQSTWTNSAIDDRKGSEKQPDTYLSGGQQSKNPRSGWGTSQTSINLQAQPTSLSPSLKEGVSSQDLIRPTKSVWAEGSHEGWDASTKVPREVWGTELSDSRISESQNIGEGGSGMSSSSVSLSSKTITSVAPGSFMPLEGSSNSSGRWSTNSSSPMLMSTLNCAEYPYSAKSFPMPENEGLGISARHSKGLFSPNIGRDELPDGTENLLQSLDRTQGTMLLQPCNSANECLGVSQSSEKASEPVMKVNRLTNDGWGALSTSEEPWRTSQGDIQCQEKSWMTTSSAEFPRSSSDSWDLLPSTRASGPTAGWGGSTGHDQTLKNVADFEVEKRAGDSWSLRKTSLDARPIGKLPLRPPGDGGRPSRNSKKDIPCKFHAKGICKRGTNCDFLHV